MSIIVECPYANILAVDDEPVNLMILEDILEDYYRVELVDSGQACFNAINACLPDLILLDVNMPDESGFDVCKRLKSQEATKHIPIIFLTALLGADDQKTGLEMGAVDYITKPFTESILLARINTHLKLADASKRLQKSNHELTKERGSIEHIIASMRDDKRFHEGNLQHILSPVEKSSGDIILSAINESNAHHVLVGDFTGHGLTAAIAGPLVSSLFYSSVHAEHPAEKVLNLINHELKNKMPTESFLAALYALWDKSTHTVSLYNFGMQPALIINTAGDVIEVHAQAPALGIVDPVLSSHPQTFEFCEGDKLYLYSDGIVEAKNKQNEQFGMENLKKHLVMISNQGQNLRTLLKTLDRFAQEETYADDITIVELSSG